MQNRFSMIALTFLCRTWLDCMLLFFLLPASSPFHCLPSEGSIGLSVPVGTVAWSLSPAEPRQSCTEWLLSGHREAPPATEPPLSVSSHGPGGERRVLETKGGWRVKQNPNEHFMQIISPSLGQACLQSIVCIPSLKVWGWPREEDTEGFWWHRGSRPQPWYRASAPAPTAGLPPHSRNRRTCRYVTRHAWVLCSRTWSSITSSTEPELL